MHTHAGRASENHMTLMFGPQGLGMPNNCHVMHVYQV